jgi:hypothetical protein
MKNRSALGNLLCGALVGGCVVLGAASPSSAGQIAASVEYEFASRPAGLPDDFQPFAGTSLRFMSIKALDGFQIEAALWQPDAKPVADTTMIVMVHGSGGSYRRAPGPGLAANGHATLAINTRQHDDRVNTDNFLDVRRDIEAAVQVARSLGYKNLVLQGHSLGSIQVQFFAATNWDPDIKGRDPAWPLWQPAMEVTKSPCAG